MPAAKSAPTAGTSPARIESPMHTPAYPPRRLALSPLAAVLAASTLCIGCGGGNANAGTSTFAATGADTTAPATHAAAETAMASITSATAAETSTSQTQQSRLERLSTAIDSMKVAQHEVRPLCSPCAGWGVKPIVVMGTEPYASALPSNWPGTRFADWRAMLGWFVIYEGVGGNTARNSAVEVSGIELWYLSKASKTWKLVQSGLQPNWGTTLAPDAMTTLSVTAAAKEETPHSTTYVPTATNVVHGGLAQAETPWNSAANRSDIDAIYLAVRHRLALRDTSGVDDRAHANFVLQAGVDYYPYLGSRVSDLKAPYVPGAGLGQFIKVSSQWRYSTMFLKSSAISEPQLLKIQPPVFNY